MSIKAINNHNFSQINISFSKKQKNQDIKKLKEETTGSAVPVSKLVPAMMALAGVMTLNSCSEDSLYRDMSDFKKEVFDEIYSSERNLSKIDEKTFVISNETDSVFKETDEYKYSHLRIKSKDNTRVFGDILRKKDGKELHFINVYDENDKLKSSTLKDPQIHETFYVTYKQGFFDKVKDKKGNELPSSKYGDYLVILGLALGLYAACRVSEEIFAKGMTNKDVPFIEPPEQKEP